MSATTILAARNELEQLPPEILDEILDYVRRSEALTGEFR